MPINSCSSNYHP